MNHIPKEFHGKIFELTLALYRVTDFLPQGETLKRNLREKANDIFGGITEYGYSEDYKREAASIVARIQAMRGFFGIARSLRFIRPINITVLEREYVSLEQFFEEETRGVAASGTKERGATANHKGHNKSRPFHGVAESMENKISDIPVSSHGDSILMKERDKDGISGGNGVDNGHNNVSVRNKKNTVQAEKAVSPEMQKEEEKTEEVRETTPQYAENPMTIEQILEHEKKRHDVVPNTNGLSPISFDINERQKTILTHLERARTAKISDLFPYFDDISSKTIQRDLQDLISKNILKKEGEKKWTVYSLQQEAARV